MKRILALSLLVACTAPLLARAQTRECLDLQRGTHVIDSARVDTCSGSPTFGQEYARSGFTLKFQDAGISLLTPLGRQAAGQEIHWSLLRNMSPELAQGLRKIETRFGRFVLRKMFPEVTDPALPASRAFMVRFPDYVPADVVERMLDALPGARGLYRNRTLTPTYIPNDKTMVPRTPWNNMLVGGTEDFWKEHLHKLGWDWGLYQMQTPMAWEITRGRNTITVAAGDVWDGTSSHPDMTNFLQVTATGDGTETTRVLGHNHGLMVLSCAAAVGDNDTPDDGNSANAGQGVVGTGFGIMGLATGQSPDFDEIDLDQTADNVTTQLDIVNLSYGDTGRGSDAIYRRAIDSGIVVISTSANGMGWHADANRFAWGTTTVSGLDTFAGPATVYPGAFAFMGATPAEDYRVICVGGTVDGELLNGNCQPWDGTNNPNWRGSERFPGNYTFSVDTSKFNTSSNAATRLAAKEAARMDIVAPSVAAVATDGAGGSEAHTRQYAADISGTSFSAPYVAGITGLMLSVNKHMGVNLRDTNGKIIRGPDVQRRVYNMLTFTADKVADFNNIPTAEQCVVDLGKTICWKYLTKPTPSTDYQFNYITQTNDDLDRSWAQRVGFGRVNAYRAVAHSIGNKGAYTYTTSQTLPFSFTGNGNVNEQGDALMHFGTWKNATDLVLAAGGESLPGESHNNQGVTKVNGTATVLTVPNDCILAIDGIVKTDNATGNNRIATSGTGKICAAGYLENVELKGTTRLSDLIIRASGTGAIGRVSIGGSALASEIYGNVRMRDNGELRVDAGTMKVRPGGIVNMAGAKDIVVTGGGTLELQAATTITGGTGRRIVVESGSKLVVAANAKNVAIQCSVVVLSGGQFIIEPDAEVTLDQFTVNNNGTMTCKEGSRLILNKKLTNTSAGFLTIEGTSTRRVKVSGRVADCCMPACTQVDSTAYITAKSAWTYTSGAKLRIRYADITNVPIKAIDIVRDPIEFNNFSASRTLLTTGDYLLSIDYTGQPYWFLNNEDLMKATVRSNHFFDEQAAIGGNRRVARYPIHGLMVRSMLRGATINSNHFTRVGYGVATLYNSNAVIQNDTFVTCNSGVYDVGSTLNVCSNIFSDADYAGIFYQTKPSKVLNNTVATARWGFTSWNASQIDFRRNNLLEFVDGLYSIESPLNLRPRGLGGFPPLDEIYGRNVFEVSGVLFPFGIGANDIRLTPGAGLAIDCGKNDMALRTALHINGFAQVINVSNNNWKDPAHANGFVRTNIATVGVPLNVAAVVGVNCGNIVQPKDCVPATGIRLACEDLPNYNTGQWPLLASNDALLTTYYTSARSSMYDTSVSVGCRKIKARDALEAAILSDSVQPRLTQLVSDYTIISTSSTAPTELRATVLVLQGEAREHMGLLSDAALSYSKVVTLYPTAHDSVPAAWSLQRVQMLMADPAFGPVYDSLLAGYGERVLADLRRIADENELPKRTYPNDDGTTGAAVATLEQNVPNPFDKETAITYTLHRQADVRLEVLDLQGSLVSVLVNESQNAGSYTAKFSTQSIAAGTYLYRLTAGEQVLTRQMVVVK